MRGKVTDQDLTDYALNELRPEDRLYVESMLAVSEECREDVYRMIDLGEMLKEGLEMEEDPTFILDESQRSKVLDVPTWTLGDSLRRVAAVALLATGIGYGVSTPGLWSSGGTADQLASAKEAVQTLITDVQTKDVAKTAEELVARLQAAAPVSEPVSLQFANIPAACTPVNMPAMPDIVEM